jgi:thiol-disulfide isomerase/thioredoxin
MTSRPLTGWLAAALAAIMLRLVLIASAQTPVALTDIDSRTNAPDLVLMNAKSAPVRLADYKGRVVLLDFWATWCTGCKIEIPWFVEFQRKYKDRGLEAVGVAMDDEGWRAVNPYLADHPISYAIVIGNLGLLESRFGLPANLPVTLLIDRQGRIAATHLGVVDRASFEKQIQQLLEEPAKQQ